MDDWSILIKNAVTVIIILIAISVLTFLAFLGLNSASKSGEKMSETVSVLDARAMETYDQKTVSGTTALAAVKTYQSRNLAIIVKTNATIVNYNALLAAKADTTNAIYTNGIHTGAVVYPIVIGTDANQYSTVNDNAANPIGLIAPKGVSCQGEYQNLDVSKATSSQYSQYINPKAKFRSVLIYNVNGEAIGIFLEQTTATIRILNF